MFSLLVNQLTGLRTKGIPNDIIDCKSSLELSSDHSPVIVTINNKLQIMEQKCQLSSSRTNWNQFKTILSTILSSKLPLKNEQDIIEATEFLIQSTQEAAWQSTQTKSKKNLAKN